MDKIKFSHNWNCRSRHGKLDCKAFLTIRLENRLKYKKGQKYEIVEGEGETQKKRGIATIKEIYIFDRDKLTDTVAYLDTGLSRNEVIELLKKMYPFCKPDTKFMFMVLVYEDSTFQTELF
jgi:hypothetical protein